MRDRIRVVALCALLLVSVAGCGGSYEQQVMAEPPRTAPPEVFAVYTPAPASEPAPIPTPDPSPTPEPDNGIFVLSFAGDCTLASEHDYYNDDWGLVSMVGDNYAYPFEYASNYLLEDDFSMVNLECALTNHNTPSDKLFRFRGPPEFTQILTLGGVDCVGLANNHSRDYGETGYKDTAEALDAAGIAYAGDGGTCLYTTERGLVIGVYSAFYRFDGIAHGISRLREAGADIVIVSCHFGQEGSYRYNYNQELYAKKAIDYGADIVFGHHPHVLQKVVQYGDGVIYYSLGNFVFGGNSNPRDKDTAIVQQYVIRQEDGTYSLGDTVVVPFALSGSSSYNDYRPVPLEEGTEQYERTLSKTDGTFKGPDLFVSYDKPSPEPSTETSTEPSTETEIEPVPEIGGEQETASPQSEDAAEGESQISPPSSGEPPSEGPEAGTGEG